MPRPGHGIDDEPHLRSGAADIDEPDHRLGDEPALRGRGDADRFTSWSHHLDERMAAVGMPARVLTMFLAVLAAGPFAVFGAFAQASLTATLFGMLALVVIVPVLEEALKVAVPMWLAERKPWLLPGSVGIVLIGLAGGAGFGAIENAMYLLVYIDDPSDTIIRWRWFLCMPMHMLASTIAALGVARMWREAIRTRRPAEIATAAPFVTAAAVIHGAFNAMAIGASMMGWVE